MIRLAGMKSLASLLFLLALAASAQAADVEKVDALIERAIAPYREMNGKVYFAGRYIYIAYGLIPKPPAKTNSVHYLAARTKPQHILRSPRGSGRKAWRDRLA